MFDDSSKAPYARASHAGPLGKFLGPCTLPHRRIRHGAAAAAEPQAAEAETLESIIVTARRREESLQDTPVAVTALSAEALERQQIVGTTDLDKIAPNLQFHSYGTLTGNNSAAQVFIRGIGQTDATPAVDPGVGIYIDDVYMGRSVGGAMDFRDIASVQILRGPQGTLFGRNTIGGAVLLTTNAPGEDAGNSVRVGLGEDNLLEVFGAFDLPLGDTWSARIALGGRAARRLRDARIRRRRISATRTCTPASWRCAGSRPTHFAFTLRGDYTKEDENGSPFVFQSDERGGDLRRRGQHRRRLPQHPRSVAAAAARRAARTIRAAATTRRPWARSRTAAPIRHPARSRTAACRWWRAGTSTIRWRSSPSPRIDSLEWTGTRDADNTPLLILHTNYDSESDQFSQELQALVDGDAPRRRRSASTTSTRIPSTGCSCRWAIPARPTTRSASSMDATAQAPHSPNGPSRSPTRSARRPACATRRRPRRLQATMFNVAPATARGAAGAHRAVSVRRPAADADRLPVPHHQPIRAGVLGHHHFGERAVPLQRAS